MLINVLLFCLGFFTITYSFLLIFYAYRWDKIPVFSSEESQVTLDRTVSIIIAARNEEEHILACVESCLSQNYPAHLLEVVVVDDQSSDDTYSLLENITDPRFKLMRLGVYKRTTIQGSKKKAIAYGVNHAAGEIILTTDADCIVPTNWVKNMVSYQKLTDADLISGPVKIHQSNSFLEKFQAVDFATSALMNGAAIQSNLHYLCNGANLAYRKEKFIQHSPYESNMHLASGDDVFLMSALQKSGDSKISFIKSQDAIVETQAVTQLKTFFSQRLRWASKMRNLADLKLNFIAAIVWIQRLLPLAVILIGSIMQDKILLIAGLAGICIQLLMDFIINYKACQFYKIKQLLWLFVPLNLFYTLYFTLTGFLSWLPIELEWKDRKI